MEVGIYVKSRFRGNPRGAGEAAAVVEYVDRAGRSHTREARAGVGNGTKNALCLKIAIEAMRLLTRPCRVTLHMDCGYMENACRLGWPEKWRREGWKKADGNPPANAGDWKRFSMLAGIHAVSFEKYDGRHEEELERMLDAWREGES